MERITNAREHLRAGREVDYRVAKDTSDWVIIAGHYYNKQRTGGQPWTSSGMVFVEYDHMESAAEARDWLITLDCVVATWLSISEQGVHVAVAVAPSPTADEDIPGSQLDRIKYRRTEHLSACYAVHKALNLPRNAGRKRSPTRAYNVRVV